MARSAEGLKCHMAEATTVSGTWPGVVDHVADGQLAFFLGGVADAEAFGVHHVGALVDHGEGGLLGLGRVEPAVDEARR